MNKIRVLFAPGERMIVAPAEFKRNTGQVLEVYGVPFDEGAVLRIAFISDGDDGAVPATGTVENGALSIPIPDDKFFDLDEDGGDEGRIRAYFAVVDGDSITTEYCVVIPLLDAPPLTDPYEDATPAQRSAIDEIIRQITTTAEAAETAKQKAETAADKSETSITKYPKIVDGNWYVWDADAEAFADTGIKAIAQDGKDGKDGADGVSPTAQVSQTADGATISITDKSGTTSVTILNGKDGKDGKDGEPGAAGQPGRDGVDGQPGAAGKDGKDGQDGFSPTATVVQTSSGARISITDKTGTTTAVVNNGVDGQPGAAGKDGVDGVSPTAKVETVSGGAKVTITDKNGTTTAVLTNGQDGQPGAAGTPGAAGKDGEDGFSPSATVTQTSTGATISITDKNGTTSANISNGTDGQPGAAGKNGEDGFSPSASVTQTPLGATISITDKTGTTAATILNGTKGDTGSSGVYVGSEEPTDENVTVWVDTDGDADDVITVSGTDPVITAQSGVRYICGEVTTLTFTPSPSGICDVIFHSGSTPAVVELPSAVKFPGGKELSIEADTTYEINIMDGIYGAVMSWT